MTPSVWAGELRTPAWSGGHAEIHHLATGDADLEMPRPIPSMAASRGPTYPKEGSVLTAHRAYTTALNGRRVPDCPENRAYQREPT